MRTGFPELGLLAGDRLEPSALMPDVVGFDHMVPPFRATFWRKDNETSTRHRNPLFDREIHVLHTTVQVDWLHTLALGVFQDAGAELVKVLRERNAWDVPGGAEARRKLTAARIESELFEFYRTERQEGRLYTQIEKIEAGYFGTDTKPLLKLHGAETVGFIAYCQTIIKKYAFRLESAKTWERVFGNLVRVKELVDLPPRQFGPPQVQEPGNLPVQTYSPIARRGR